MAYAKFSRRHRLKYLVYALVGLFLIYEAFQLSSHEFSIEDIERQILSQVGPTSPSKGHNNQIPLSIPETPLKKQDGSIAKPKLSAEEVAQELKDNEAKEEDEIPEKKVPSRPLTPEELASVRDLTVFFNDMEKYSIKAPSIKDKYKTEKARELFAGADDFLFSKEYLENVLDISPDTFNVLKDSHTRYLQEHIPKLVDDLGLSTFGSILESDPEWKDYHGSAGYVLVGGERYSWLSYLVIRQIRATGAKLPIELFIPSELEYEKDFCETVLPKYNAKCVVFNTDFARDLSKRFNIGGYQFKMLALLSSKFENILYLDSDNFPTKNVEYIFDSEIYKKRKLILWPDAWARTTNPKFFEIAGVKVLENKLRYSDYDRKQAELADKPLKKLSEYTFEDSWFHDFEGTLPNPTSETGMLIINKTTHLKTLLLCLYYNVFGPDFYYPLLTQGSAGEGDKETFIAAASVLKKPWFQTPKQFRWTGYFKENDEGFTSKALGHHDPIQSLKAKDDKEEVDIIFMHLSYPKFYPSWLVDNHDLVYEKSGNHIRMYADINDNVGYDFDLRVLQLFTQGLCKDYYDLDGIPIDGTDGPKRSVDYMGKYLRYISTDETKNKERCEKVFLPHLKWLKDTTKFPKSKSVIV
ncbi:mannosyltransferase putative-domain-containing protein [Scheffersomyces coipomensis]|uniref:mannosyltransferase putative-domain-containing protein n=1 Tax=Scheffersomyces coipomensis TaxID=1788519 RepID=UPI00315CFFD1